MRISFVLLGLAMVMTAQAASLPDSVVFVGKGKFESLVNKGIEGKWSELPIGERTAKVGLALVGTPYKNFTLELSDRVETPCVNMLGMDCWTFFETSLGTARVLKMTPNPTPGDLLKVVEMDRYRGGHCTGIFTSRLHQLEDWLYDNQRRGLVKDVTPSLPGARQIHREVEDMAPMGKKIPQFRANPSLIPVMAGIEQKLTERGIWYVPKSKVPAAEKFLKNGDIICIVSNWPHDYTSHVGLAYRDASGVLRFLHASKNHHEVTIDERLSDYLNSHSTQAGIMVARPNDI